MIWKTKIITREMTIPKVTPGRILSKPMEGKQAAFGIGLRLEGVILSFIDLGMTRAPNMPIM